MLLSSAFAEYGKKTAVQVFLCGSFYEKNRRIFICFLENTKSKSKNGCFLIYFYSVNKLLTELAPEMTVIKKKGNCRYYSVDLEKLDSSILRESMETML